MALQARADPMICQALRMEKKVRFVRPTTAVRARTANTHVNV